MNAEIETQLNFGINPMKTMKLNSAEFYFHAAVGGPLDCIYQQFIENGTRV